MPRVTDLARPGDTAGNAPATGPGSSTGAHHSGKRNSAGRGSEPSATASDEPSPSKSPAKPKHQSGTLVAYGPNLLVDGDFSQGTLEPWNYVTQNATIEPGNGVDHLAAVRLLSTPQAAVGQTVTGLKPGASYEVTGWAYTNGGKIGIGAMDTVDNTINDHELTTASSWTELSAVFKVPAKQGSATIYCIMAWGGTGYCSDLTFRAMHRA
jgi:hypothetical protein